MNVVASIQARLGSTRLPGKVLYPLGEKRVLEWCIDRTEQANSIDQTVVAVGDRPENDALHEFCDRNNVSYSVGPEDNLLSRHLSVSKETDCDLLVRITADCPFLPSREIDRVINEHLSSDCRYTTNVTDQMPIGTAVDAIDPDVLEQLSELGETHPVKRPRSNTDEWKTNFTSDESWRSVSEAHLAVDTPNDYWTLVDALDEVGDDPFEAADWICE